MYLFLINVYLNKEGAIKYFDENEDLNNSEKFPKKHLYQSLIFDKGEGSLQSYLERDSVISVFPLILSNFLDTSRRLILLLTLSI